MSSIVVPHVPHVPHTGAATRAGTGARVAADRAVASRGTAVRARWIAPVAGLLAGMAVALVVVLGAAYVGQQYRDATGVAARVDGHVMVEPGSSLWDVAERTAPAGVDPATQFAALQEINGFADLHTTDWTVVLLPAH